MDPNSGSQTIITQNGYLQQPTDITEAPDGTLYITDNGSNYSGGAVIHYDPSTGQQTLLTSGGNLNGPAAILYIGGYLYVDNQGQTNGSLHTLIRIDPNNPSNQTVISSGATNQFDGSTGFLVPLGMYPVPGDSNDLYLVDQQQRIDNSSGQYHNLHGRIWEINLTTGAPTLKAVGDPSSTSGYQYLDTDVESASEDAADNGGVEETYGNPEDVAVDGAGNLITLIQGDQESPYEGIVIKVYPNGSGPTLVSSGSTYTTTVSSIEIDSVTGIYGSGTIYVGIALVNPNPMTGQGGHPAWIIAVNPNTGAQYQITSGQNLALVEGLCIYGSIGGGEAPKPPVHSWSALRIAQLQAASADLGRLDVVSASIPTGQNLVEPFQKGWQQPPLTDTVKKTWGSANLASNARLTPKLTAVDSLFAGFANGFGPLRLLTILDPLLILPNEP